MNAVEHLLDAARRVDREGMVDYTPSGHPKVSDAFREYKRAGERANREHRAARGEARAREQLGLAPVPDPIRGKYRVNDPRTSRDAAEAHAASQRMEGNKLVVFAAVMRHPGQTGAEIGEVTGKGQHEAVRRLNDLRRMKLVYQGERRGCRVKGSQMVTWWPTVPVEVASCQLAVDGGES